MRFLLMMHAAHGAGDYQYHEWTPDDWRAHLDYWRTLNQGLKDAGEYVDVLALTPPAEARVVRAAADGTPSVTDGPFPEAKEFLAGFWVVDVENRERAFEIAATASLAPGPGGVPLRMPIEVREVMRAPAADA